MISAVKGTATTTYIFGFGGGLDKNSLIAETRADMLSQANLVGGSRAIINETVEVKHSLFPIVRMFTVVVSGHVIEFTR